MPFVLVVIFPYFSSRVLLFITCSGIPMCDVRKEKKKPCLHACNMQLALI